jgi:hypothetical protein
VLSNESGGLIDDLITAGYGNSNLYQTLVSLAPASGGVITERFLETLANCPPGSEIFTAKLSDFAGLNNPVGVNIDGTLVISSIFGRDYFGETGYATYPNTPAYGELFTYATSELYYIDTGSTVIDSDYENYQAFAIAWTVEPELKVNQSVIRKPAGSQHTVTASLAFEGVPNQGVRIDFLITDGPNAGKSGSQLTDINGQARFTYIGDHGAGQDTILVTAFDQTGSPLDSVQTTRDWSGAPSGVGGEVATVNRLDLLTPWMFFILMLFTGGTILALRNHKKTK